MITKKAIIDGDVVCSYDSSNILASKYSKGNKTLVITFKRGAQYQYSDVSEKEYEAFEMAESQGVVFNKTIKQKTFTNLGNADIKLILEDITKHSVPIKKELNKSEKTLILTMESFLLYHKTKTELSLPELEDLKHFVDKVIVEKKNGGTVDTE